MIVRVSGEDQYRLADSDDQRFGELDAAVHDAVQAGDEQAFEDSYRVLLSFLRAQGTRVGDDEIETSDVILPPADMTLAEAVGEFTGEGLIPD